MPATPKKKHVAKTPIPSSPKRTSPVKMSADKGGDTLRPRSGKSPRRKSKVASANRPPKVVKGLHPGAGSPRLLTKTRKSAGKTSDSGSAKSAAAKRAAPSPGDTLSTDTAALNVAHNAEKPTEKGKRKKKYSSGSSETIEPVGFFTRSDFLFDEDPSRHPAGQLDDDHKLYQYHRDELIAVLCNDSIETLAARHNEVLNLMQKVNRFRDEHTDEPLPRKTLTRLEELYERLSAQIQQVEPPERPDKSTYHTTARMAHINTCRLAIEQAQKNYEETFHIVALVRGHDIIKSSQTLRKRARDALAFYRANDPEYQQQMARKQAPTRKRGTRKSRRPSSETQKMVEETRRSLQQLRATGLSDAMLEPVISRLKFLEEKAAAEAGATASAKAPDRKRKRASATKSREAEGSIPAKKRARKATDVTAAQPRSDTVDPDSPTLRDGENSKKTQVSPLPEHAWKKITDSVSVVANLTTNVDSLSESSSSDIELELSHETTEPGWINRQDRNMGDENDFSNDFDSSADEEPEEQEVPQADEAEADEAEADEGEADEGEASAGSQGRGHDDLRSENPTHNMDIEPNGIEISLATVPSASQRREDVDMVDANSDDSDESVSSSNSSSSSSSLAGHMSERRAPAGAGDRPAQPVSSAETHSTPRAAHPVPRKGPPPRKASVAMKTTSKSPHQSTGGKQLPLRASQGGKRVPPIAPADYDSMFIDSSVQCNDPYCLAELEDACEERTCPHHAESFFLCDDCIETKEFEPYEGCPICNLQICGYCFSRPSTYTKDRTTCHQCKAVPEHLVGYCTDCAETGIFACPYCTEEVDTTEYNVQPEDVRARMDVEIRRESA